ncbi:MAG: hypothetical protein ETSY1_07240 [Candidatus Entotheonella factor]|uniref:Uncharacterized protein n=1 Tax=Entotheonella factor TaxID=1429438 RepID=W4LU05_ENTF1|nr:MAG: hypothetical protein ETSY1_07240 [Candidatus Entotheonella factor]
MAKVVVVVMMRCAAAELVVQVVDWPLRDGM